MERKLLYFDAHTHFVYLPLCACVSAAFYPGVVPSPTHGLGPTGKVHRGRGRSDHPVVQRKKSPARARAFSDPPAPESSPPSLREGTLCTPTARPPRPRQEPKGRGRHGRARVGRAPVVCRRPPRASKVGRNDPPDPSRGSGRPRSGSRYDGFGPAPETRDRLLQGTVALRGRERERRRGSDAGPRSASRAARGHERAAGE